MRVLFWLAGLVAGGLVWFAAPVAMLGWGCRPANGATGALVSMVAFCAAALAGVVVAMGAVWVVPDEGGALRRVRQGVFWAACLLMAGMLVAGVMVARGGRVTCL